MGIKVHGYPVSCAAQRVFLCLQEKGLEYEYIHIDLLTGQQKKKPYISLNPFEQVPAFEDGDLKLFESRAINQYVSHAYADKGTPLISFDTKKMAIISVWMEVEAQRFADPGSKLTFEIEIKPMIGLITNEGVAEQLAGQLACVLDVYEARLAECKYLGGDSFSLADLHHIPVINSLLKTKYKDLFDERPHVGAWARDIIGRPAAQKVLGY